MLNTPASIVVARKMIGASQNDLAAMLDVNVRTLRAWETGDATPPPGVIHDFAAILDERRSLVNAMTTAVTMGKSLKVGKGGPFRDWEVTAAALVLHRHPDANIEWAEDPAAGTTTEPADTSA